MFPYQYLTLSGSLKIRFKQVCKLGALLQFLLLYRSPAWTVACGPSRIVEVIPCWMIPAEMFPAMVSSVIFVQTMKHRWVLQNNNEKAADISFLFRANNLSYLRSGSFRPLTFRSLSSFHSTHLHSNLLQTTQFTIFVGTPTPTKGHTRKWVRSSYQHNYLFSFDLI